MATRYAVATGNWSDTATWNGGTLPTSSDDVYADGKTVTIDQNVTVLSLRTTTRSGGTNAGTFVFTSGITVTAGVPNVSGGFYAGLYGAFSYSGAGTLTLNGDWNVSAITTSGTATGFMISSGVVNTFGRIYYSNNGNPTCLIQVTGTGVLNHTGNLIGGAGGAGNDGIWVTLGGQVNIVGSITHSTGYGRPLALRSGSSVGNSVTGNVSATAQDGGVITVESPFSGTLTITGNITAQGSGGQVVLLSGTAASVTVIGVLTSSSGHLALSSSLTTLKLTGPFVSSATGSMMPFSASRVTLFQTTNTYFEFRDTSNNPVRMVTTDTLPSVPVPSNVRLGISYGSGQTGTLAVPPAASVAYGVPVDNTTGTATLSPSDVSSVIGAAIAAALDSVP